MYRAHIRGRGHYWHASAALGCTMNKTLRLQGLIQAERGGFEPPMTRRPY